MSNETANNANEIQTPAQKSVTDRIRDFKQELMTEYRAKRAKIEEQIEAAEQVRDEACKPFVDACEAIVAPLEKQIVALEIEYMAILPKPLEVIKREDGRTAYSPAEVEQAKKDILAYVTKYDYMENRNETNTSILKDRGMHTRLGMDRKLFDKAKNELKEEGKIGVEGANPHHYYFIPDKPTQPATPPASGVEITPDGDIPKEEIEKD